MKIAWGRWTGYELDKIPDDNYIRWLHQEATIRSRILREAVAQEYDHRFTRSTKPSKAVLEIEPCQVALAHRVFEAGFRSLLKQTHPDAGGRTGEMQSLNLLRDSVKSQLQQLNGGVQ